MHEIPQVTRQSTYRPVGSPGRFGLKVVSTIFCCSSVVKIGEGFSFLRSVDALDAGAHKGLAGDDHRGPRETGLLGDGVIGNSLAGQQNHTAFSGHSLPSQPRVHQRASNCFKLV